MDQVAQVREKIDIVALISEYLTLKKAGRNFKTPCPFHNEKTPSFIVSPERQIWHCFGCQKGGDCFTFLMEYENLEFPEALRILARKVGIELESRGFDSSIHSKKEKIYAFNKLAGEFYHYVLTKHNAGKKALNYILEKRGIKPQVINTFMLGFSPGVGNALSNYLINKKKFKGEDLIEAGLAMQRRGGVADFFAGRIMFPLFDHRDNIVGFSARDFSASTGVSGSKYINTRETLVYHKGSLFFGLNIAKDEIKKTGTAIIMEGEFDVMSSFQNGIGNAVAVKGTALTENQVALIARFAPKVSLCFDEDSAGQEAVKRSLFALEKKGLATTIITSPNGKDPDESLKNDPFVFKTAVKNDIGVYDYLIHKMLVKFGKNTIDSKKSIADELLPLLIQIENEIVKEHYLKKLSSELDTSYESIVRQAEKLKSKEKDKDLKMKTKDKKDREEMLEEYLLALIIQHSSPKIVLEKVVKILSSFAFKVPALQKLLSYLLSFFETNDKFDSNKFLQMIPVELISAFDACFLLPLTKFSDDSKYIEEVEKIAKDLKMLYLRSQIKIIGEKIKEGEKNQDKEEVEMLQKDLTSLVSNLQES